MCSKVLNINRRTDQIETEDLIKTTQTNIYKQKKNKKRKEVCDVTCNNSINRNCASKRVGPHPIKNSPLNGKFDLFMAFELHR